MNQISCHEMVDGSVIHQVSQTDVPRNVSLVVENEHLSASGHQVIHDRTIRRET